MLKKLKHDIENSSTAAQSEEKFNKWLTKMTLELIAVGDCLLWTTVFWLRDSANYKIFRRESIGWITI